MALVNRSIPNLYNGVSQQPPALRLPSQAEEQINGISSVVYGLFKRPPTKHLAKLNALTVQDSYVHTINRDTSNQFVVVITNGDLAVYAIDGTAQTVSFPDGKAYLTASTPRTSFAAVTVADYTFIVNKTVTAAALGTLSGNYIAPVSLTSLVNLVSKTVSSVTSSGTTATVTTSTVHGLKVGHKVKMAGATQAPYNGTFIITAVPSTTTFKYVMEQTTTTTATGTITYVSYAVTMTTGTAHGIVANNLVITKGATQAEYNGSFKVVESASTTTLTFNLDSDPTITTATGTITYDAVQTQFKGSKQKFTDLPATGLTDGDVWEVAGDVNNNFDNYYVRYDSTSVTWRETVKPGILVSLDSTTMPYKLVNNGGGNFTCSKIEWNDRTVGDDTSAKFPSIIGKQIADVFFHRNRLGFIAGENVVFSRSGDFFNLFPETVTAVLDTDPVDVAVSHSKVAVLRHALAFNTSLMLFADQAQFQLTAKDVLTPKTATLNVTTEFTIEPNARPASAATSIFFASTKGTYSQVREYMVQPLTYTNDAADITAHVPKYLPKNIFKLAASSLDDVLIGLSLDERNAVYVYKYYWGSPEEKIQSSWSKFTIDSTGVILNADFIGTTLYLVVGRSDGMYLESVNFQETNDALGFVVGLDQRTSLTGSYSSGTGLTTWTLPYPVTGALACVLGASYTGKEGTVINLTNATSTTVTASGNYSTGTVWIGRPYTMSYKLSPIHFKDENRNSVVHYTVKLRNLFFMFSDTGYFKATVKPKNRDAYEYRFTGKTLADPSMTLGNVGIVSGKFKVPVFSDAFDTAITIMSDSPLPCQLQACEWEGILTNSSKHI